MIMAYDAAIRAVFKLLVNTGATWNKVFIGNAEDEAVYPYVLITSTGTNEANRRRHDDAIVNLSIKAYDTNQSRALTCASEIQARINDAGIQDIGSAYGTSLDGGTNWDILTATTGRFFHVSDPFASSVDIWQSGGIYTLVMESK